jgi:microcystin-dependent protein
MSALNFPQSPTIGQIYEHPDAGSYEWNGYAWIKKKAEVSSVPKGAIIMWSGLETDLPSGWAICDGTQGTPNLRNRFIVGSGVGSDNPVGSTGGAASMTLSVANMPSHSHGATASISGNISGTTSEAGAHTHPHNANICAAGHIIQGGSQGTTPLYSAATIDSAGAHTHTFSGTISGGSVTIAAEGGSQAFSILPPFYSLAFIMKI